MEPGDSTAAADRTWRVQSELMKQILAEVERRNLRSPDQAYRLGGNGVDGPGMAFTEQVDAKTAAALNKAGVATPQSAEQAVREADRIAALQTDGAVEFTLGTFKGKNNPGFDATGGKIAVEALPDI